MHRPDSRESDPIAWCAAITLAFLALALLRLGVPSHVYFDETHYVPAARSLLKLEPANSEHPMFAKEAIAAAIAIFGDRALAWRAPSALLGTFGLFAFSRLVWILARRRMATICATMLLATNFMWFVQSRIAMLDIYAAALAMAGLWQFAAALENRRPRMRLALAGLAMGFAIASKWSAAPLAMLPGLAMLALKLLRTELPLVRRISLPEAAGWLGLLPAAAYWLTFAPAMFYPDEGARIAVTGIVEHHRKMIALHESVTQAHPYQSVWWQWLLNLRPIWYLYEAIDGAQRGILLLGNPLTMPAGLPALAWCVWAGLAARRLDALAMALGFAASLAPWLLPGKPVQFYYHYLAPGAFLAGALGLALDRAWRRGGTARATSMAALAASVGVFAWFWPILSAAPLADRQAFAEWMWLDSWR